MAECAVVHVVYVVYVVMETEALPPRMVSTNSRIMDINQDTRTRPRPGSQHWANIYTKSQYDFLLFMSMEPYTKKEDFLLQKEWGSRIKLKL